MLVGFDRRLSLPRSIVYIFASGNPLLFQSFPTQLFGGVDNYGLISIPLFVLSAEIMNGGGITRRIIDMTMAFGRARCAVGSYVNLLANMFVASILGSATAQVAVMAQMMVPEMEKKGYDKTFAAGLTAYSGMLGPIIPPSIMFVVYSVLAQVPVSDMLAAGIVPGILLTVAFCLVIAARVSSNNYPRGERMKLKERIPYRPGCAASLLIPSLSSARSSPASPTRRKARSRRRRCSGARRPLLDRRAQILRASSNDAARRDLFGRGPLPRRGRAVFSWVLVYGHGAAAGRGWGPDGRLGSGHLHVARQRPSCSSSAR